MVIEFVSNLEFEICDLEYLNSRSQITNSRFETKLKFKSFYDTVSLKQGEGRHEAYDWKQ